jgi:Zn-dependent M28 family amino/carboxypeptidase
MIMEELNEISGGNCEVERFPFLNWIPVSQSLARLPGGEIPVTQLGYSAVGEVEAELTDCGTGTKEECRGARGKIALCSSGLDGSLQFLHRIQKYRNAVRAGALGFLLSGEAGHPPPEGMIRKRAKGDIPAVSLTHEAARKNLFARETVRLRMSVSNTVREDQSANVVWRTGRGHPGVVLCAHMDSWTPGAWDNASGTAVLLELASEFVKHDYAREITLCFTGCEEFGLFGSRDFCRRHAKDFRLAVNVDGVGLAGADIQVRCGERDLAGIPPLKGTYSELPLTPWGDHFSFQKSGVPSLFLTSGGINPVQHTREDSPKILNPQDLEASLNLINEIVAYQLSIP